MVGFDQGHLLHGTWTDPAVNRYFLGRVRWVGMGLRALGNEMGMDQYSKSEVPWTGLISGFRHSLWGESRVVGHLNADPRELLFVRRWRTIVVIRILNKTKVKIKHYINVEYWRTENGICYWTMFSFPTLMQLSHAVISSVTLQGSDWASVYFTLSIHRTCPYNNMAESPKHASYIHLSQWAGFLRSLGHGISSWCDKCWLTGIAPNYFLQVLFLLPSMGVGLVQIFPQWGTAVLWCFSSLLIILWVSPYGLSMQLSRPGWTCPWPDQKSK